MYVYFSLCPLSLSNIASPPSPLATPIVRKAGEEIVVQQGNHILWNAHIECQDVLVTPYAKCVIYVADGSTHARRYSGQFLWSHSNIGSGPTATLHAGENRLFQFSTGSTTHGAFSNWRALFSTAFVKVLDLRTGKLIWEDVVRNMGTPIWANENYFLSVGTDTSTMLHSERPLLSKPLKTYLELRRVHYGSLVKRVRIPGWLHKEQVRRISHSQIEIKCDSYSTPVTPQETKEVKRPFTVRISVDESKNEQTFAPSRYHFSE